MGNNHLHVTGNTLSFQGKAYRCAIGKNGFSTDKKEGDGCTPVGTFALRECWYRADRLAAPKTGLPLRIITELDGWCDDPKSAEYNRHIKLPLPLGEGRGEGSKPSPSGRGLGEGLIKRARELRQLSTTPEQKLWAILRNRQMQGYKFRRQHPLLTYVADFFCKELKLVVEVDGETHATEEAIRKDTVRTAALQKIGYHVVRFTNQEIMQNLEGVYETLTLTLSQRERELNAQKPSPAGVGLGGDLPHHENLFRDDHVYDLIIPLGYNDAPIVAGKGSAIFLHIAHDDYRGTEGCIALAKKDVLEILSYCDVKSSIEIVAG